MPLECLLSLVIFKCSVFVHKNLCYCLELLVFNLKHFSIVLLATNLSVFVHLGESLFQLDFVNDKFAGYRILA